MEIERKYLVKSLPDDLDAYPHVDIEQGYLCTSPTLRIRRAGDAYWLTVKENRSSHCLLRSASLTSEGEGMGVPIQNCEEENRSSPCQGEVPEGRRGAPIQNREEEFALSPDRFAHLRNKCDGQLVRKTRYRIPLDCGLTAELDIFHGPHRGLLLVEVEFPDSLQTVNGFYNTAIGIADFGTKIASIGKNAFSGHNPTHLVVRGGCDGIYESSSERGDDKRPIKAAYFGEGMVKANFAANRIMPPSLVVVGSTMRDIAFAPSSAKMAYDSSTVHGDAPYPSKGLVAS